MQILLNVGKNKQKMVISMIKSMGGEVSSCLDVSKDEEIRSLGEICEVSYLKKVIKTAIEKGATFVRCSNNMNECSPKINPGHFPRFLV